ncbi:MAG: M48 family metalloprotease, partial [Armatimonadetes bacterium]|nr:M48 family metalloprotease [Armatimonadota bacterium]
MRKSRPLLGAALVVMAVLLIAGCDEDDIERMIGDNVAASVERSYPVLNNPAAQDWLTYVGQTTVGFSTRQHIPYTFQVLDSDTVNAFAAPWGHVYFFTGLLDMAEDEDEVWGVMAHEVGHVVHRDIIKAVKRSILWSIGVNLVQKRSRSLGEVLGIGLGLLSFSYSRDDEREADDYAARSMLASAHDPNYLTVFFTRLMEKYEKDKPSKIAVLLRTHPLTSERIQRLKKRPELDPENAAALARIGDGYLRRGRPLTAMRFLQRALEKNPDLVSARLSLAEAALRRGYLEQANEELRKACEKLGYVPSLERRLAYAASLQPRAWPEPTQEEKSEVERLLAEARSAGEQVAQQQSAAAQTRAGLLAQVETLSARSRMLMEQVSDLSSKQVEISDTMQASLVSGNAAMNSVAELVSVLEGVSDTARATAGRLTEAREIVERVAAATSKALAPGADGWLRRSLADLQKAPKDLQESLAAASEAVPVAQKAVASAADVANYMARLLEIGDNNLLFDSLRAASESVRANAAAAAEATKKSRLAATRAEARIFVAELNLAAVGATPEELDSLVGMVAYFTRSSPERVRHLLRQGLGLGEAAACLLSYKALSRPPAEIARAAAAGNSIVDAVESMGG